MRVAHFIQRYPPALGGSEAYFARLSRFLAQAGDSVRVFTSPALDLEALWSNRAASLPPGKDCIEGVQVRRYPLWRWPGRRYLLKALSFFPNRTWQCLMLPCNPISFPMWRDAGQGADRFDIVHASAFPYAWPIVCARRLARWQGIPFLLTPFLHLGAPDDRVDRTRRAYLSPALLALVSSADAIFVQTRLELDALAKSGIEAEKLVLLGMGVDAPECTGGNRALARRSWSIPDGEVIVGHLANNSLEKGTVDLVSATEKLWQNGSRFQLVLAGPEMPNFRSFIKNSPIASQIRRLGVLSEAQKRDFYAGIDIFALPSRSDSFGLVLLEAWANGVPNVAYKAGGIAEVIHDGQDGLLAPCGDVAELAAALSRLIRDEPLRRALGQTGKERTRTEFLWEEKLKLVRQVYERMRITKTREQKTYPGRH
jgi:glycosyltransferase involved in cell wall biosynthesis